MILPSGLRGPVMHQLVDFRPTCTAACNYGDSRDLPVG